MDDSEPSLPELLAACGLVPVGDPPAVTVDVLGRAVHMEFAVAESHIVIDAKVASATVPTQLQLDEASLAAPGDCWFSLDGQQLVGRRTLVKPAAGDLFAVIHELGKQVVALGGLASAPAPAPEPAPTPSAAAPVPAATDPAGAGSWFFVDTATPLLAAPGSDETVAMLMPSVWYQVVRHDGEWTWADHPSGVQGAVARAVINPA